MKRLRADTSGNALIITALSLPAVIGSAGLATDAAQWYMWKRELQFAVDQAALAGAHAMAHTSQSVRNTYSARALQEYNANISTVTDFDGTAPGIGLAAYNGAAANNSVVVTATASKRLPFSSIFMTNATAVNVRAQATYQTSVNFSACLLALNTTAPAAVQTGNAINGTASCGLGSLSSDGEAIKETGDSSINFGTIVATGGVDSGYNNNGTIYQDQEGLSNPYSGLSAPDPSGQPSRTYPSTCPVATPESTTYKANGSTRTRNTYKYYKGTNQNNWTLQTSYNGSLFIADGWTTPVTFADKSVTSSATVGVQAETTPAQGTISTTGSGQNKYWRVPFSSTQDTIDVINVIYTPAADDKVYLSPGVYSSLQVKCTTVFAPGVYFVSGTLDFGQNKVVTGTGGVMFVLTGTSSAMHINSDSNVTLSGISTSTLINSYGYSAADAAKMAGMLIWDPNSTAAITINGNSTLHLNGVLYMPKREATFNGNGSSGSLATNCMMVAADKIKLTGNYSVSNFCTTTGGSAMSIGGGQATVKLVA